MLVPIQPSGTKPPLFFVHGVYGVMPVGREFARVLGPDQPVYSIHADGIDGRKPPIGEVREMATAYAEDIASVHPTGQIRLGGMCSGCLIAIEIVRRLNDRHTGPVILADPPIVMLHHIKQNPAVDQHPQAAAQLYRQARNTLLDHAAQSHYDIPFDFHDPKQLHVATLTAIATLAAFARYVPDPFPGSAELIVSSERAPGFFHPQMPWHKLLAGPRIVHVLPWGHRQLFGAGLEEVSRLLKFMLERPHPADTAAADEKRTFVA